MSARRAVRKALVLGGDDIRPLIGAVRSLGRGLVQVHLAWYPADSLALHSRFVHRAHILPPYSPTEPAWKSALMDLMNRERFDLVLPCSDPVSIPLQAHRQDLEPFGKIYLLENDVFRLVSNKFKMNARARSAAVPVPRQQIIARMEDVEEVKSHFTLPVVLKPCYSFDPDRAGQRQTVCRVYTWKQFSHALEAMLSQGSVAVQENFIGQGVGVELLLHEGRSLLEFQHVRLHEPLQGGGSYYRKGVPVNPVLREAALAILSPLRYTGVAMVEFKVNPATGQWVFIEVNGRFWGSLPLAIASGADFPLALFQLLVEGRTDFANTYRPGLCCRYWTGDWHWQAANFRADKSDPTLATRPLSTVLRETVVNLLTLRERSDNLTLDDPRPGVVEFIRLLGVGFRWVRRKQRQRWLALPIVRRCLRRRGLTALRQARTILFACKGNICRSPFAERLAQQLLDSGQTCSSAGYFPVPDRPSPDSAIAAAARFGVDLTSHRSVALTEEDVRRADVIVVFDEENYERLGCTYGYGKIYPLGALCPDGALWVADPYGRSVEDFEQTYERIRDAITTALQHLVPA